MIDNMLFLARTDPASAFRERQELSATDEVERIADYFEGLASDMEMHISAKSEGAIWAEPMLLRRALANLCANAIKYGAPGSELMIPAIPADEGILLRVSNNGDTIPSEHLPQLYERFTGWISHGSAGLSPMGWGCQLWRPSCNCMAGATV